MCAKAHTAVVLLYQNARVVVVAVCDIGYGIHERDDLQKVCKRECLFNTQIYAVAVQLPSVQLT